MMDARDLLHGPAEHLLDYCPVSLTTARRWQRRGRLPPVPARLLELARFGELGTVFPAWAGFSLRDDRLLTRDGFWVSTGEICAIPYRAQQLAALELQLRTPQQGELFR